MRHDLTSAVEGYYLIRVLEGLQTAGVLDALRGGASPADVAIAAGLDARLLEGLVEFLTRRSDLLAAPQPPLDLYIGAFGPCLDTLPGSLRRPSSGAALVDNTRHAAAFSAGNLPALHLNLLRELQVESLLELGCASGELLHRLAEAPGFSGIGVDANPAAVTAARARAAADTVGDRLRFVLGEAIEASTTLPERERAEIQAIFASSLFNGYFGWEGPGLADAVLRLGVAFPGRILVVADYYGALGQGREHQPGLGWVHDVAQLVSGQGVPPPDARSWSEHYSSGGATLLQSLESESDGVRTFVHLVQLGR